MRDSQPPNARLAVAGHGQGQPVPKGTQLKALARNKPLTAVVATLLMWAVTAAVLLAWTWRTEREELNRGARATQERAAALTRVFAAHVERTFRQADVLARLVADRYRKEGDGLDLVRVVREGLIPIDVFMQLAVTDAQGVVRASSVPGWRPIDVSDRAHVNVHFDRAAARPFFISQPLVGRVSNTATLQYSVAVPDNYGRLRGVVVVSISPSYFSDYFPRQELGEHGVVTLFGSEDGVVRARRRGDSDEGGQRVPADDPIWRGVLSGAPGVLVDHVSAVDGRKRAHAYRAVPGFPLGVTVGLDTESELAPLREHIRQMWWAAVVAIATTGALALANLYYVLRWAGSHALRREAEQRGRRLQDRITAIVEVAPDALMLVSPEGKVEVVNEAFGRLSGATVDAVMGLPAADAVRNLCACQDVPYSDEIAALWQPAGDGGERRAQARRTVPHPLLLEFRSWPVHGEASRVLSVRDITAENEVQRLKTEFVTTAAHELRTPMASVLGFSELLLTDDLLESERREASEAIYRQASRLTVMLNDFLDLARIEARAGLDFRLAAIDIVGVVRDSVAEFGYVALDRKLELDEGGIERLMVKGDAAKLAQVLHNLLSNAMKYSQAPAPIVIRVRQDTEQRQAVVEVIDEGIGMTPAELARVFEGFYRADDSGQTVGSGLGLVLARRIVEVHRGTLELRSHPGKGTVATMRLPLEPASGPAGPA